MNPYTSQQQNIITGLLLGDGHLQKRNENCNAILRVERSIKDKDYANYHIKIFDNHVTNVRLKEFSKYNKKVNKTYDLCRFFLRANPYLSELHSQWYQDGKKIIPKNLELNSEIIATWFCDDGHIQKSKNNYFRIILSTQSFSKEEVVFLKDLLEVRYKNKISIYNVTKNQ